MPARTHLSSCCTYLFPTTACLSLPAVSLLFSSCFLTCLPAYILICDRKEAFSGSFSPTVRRQGEGGRRRQAHQKENFGQAQAQGRLTHSLTGSVSSLSLPSPSFSPLTPAFLWLLHYTFVRAHHLHSPAFLLDIPVTTLRYMLYIRTPAQADSYAVDVGWVAYTACCRAGIYFTHTPPRLYLFFSVVPLRLPPPRILPPFRFDTRFYATTAATTTHRLYFLTLPAHTCVRLVTFCWAGSAFCTTRRLRTHLLRFSCTHARLRLYREPTILLRLFFGSTGSYRFLPDRAFAA